MTTKTSRSFALRFGGMLGVLLLGSCGLEKLNGLSEPATEGNVVPPDGGEAGGVGAGVGDGGTFAASGGGAGSRGGAGAQGGTSGSASAGIGGASSAGAAGVGCPDEGTTNAAGNAGNGSTPAPEEPCIGDACYKPVGIRLMGETGTRFGGDGGSLTFDLCLEDEAPVAVRWDTGVSSGRGTDSRVMRLQAECAKLSLQGDGSYTTHTTFTRMLLARGKPSFGEVLASGRVECPANHVIVGVQGTFGSLTGTTAYGYAIKELAFVCAALNVVAEGAAYSVKTGNSSSLPSFGQIEGHAIADQAMCGPGQIARGFQIRSGRWLDAVGVVCGTPKLTLPRGAPCSDAALCGSGVCSTTCQPPPDCAACGCSCLSYELRQYAFCNNFAPIELADSQCKSASMHLVHPNSLAESGWLRTAANAVELNGSFWLGVERNSISQWQYSDGGGEVPLELQSPKADTFWRENEPNNFSANKTCVELSIEGSWNDIECLGLIQYYACEK